MATVDVTVMGAGVLGLSVAYACTLRGASVRVIDPNGVASGASGGVVGALAPHVPELWNSKKQFQLESLLMQADFWADVTARTGLATGYCRSGRLQPLADADAIALARARIVTAQDLWGDAAVWEVVQADDTPWMPPSPSGMVVHDTLTASIHPRAATHALAAAFQTLGGEIVTHAAPQGRVVWATGWRGLAEMTAQHTRLVGAGVKGQGALFKFAAIGLPQLFAETLHIVPHYDGTVAVGSTTERDFDDGSATDELLEAVIEKARRVFPVLADAPVIARWAGVRPRSRTRAPMLGDHPFKHGEFIANGGFKIGFGMAPKIGQVMADLVLEGRDTVPDDFRSERNL